jgi:hypothetical protein
MNICRHVCMYVCMHCKHRTNSSQWALGLLRVAYGQWLGSSSFRNATKHFSWTPIRNHLFIICIVHQHGVDHTKATTAGARKVGVNTIDNEFRRVVRDAVVLRLPKCSWTVSVRFWYEKNKWLGCNFSAWDQSGLQVEIQSFRLATIMN